MDISELMKTLKDPQALQRQVMEVQSRMAAVTAVGSAGGGMVKITLNGTLAMVRVEISPEVLTLGDVQILQDLIRAAHSDASTRIREAVQSEVGRTIGPMPPLFGSAG